MSRGRSSPIPINAPRRIGGSSFALSLKLNHLNAAVYTYTGVSTYSSECAVYVLYTPSVM
jgi:hypothetical protein